MKCENCIYRKNCQFLAKHKKVKVSDCTAFVSETDFVEKAKAEAVREFAEVMKENLKNVAKEEIMGREYYLIGLSFVDNLVNEMFPKQKGE